MFAAKQMMGRRCVGTESPRRLEVFISQKNVVFLAWLILWPDEEQRADD